jgi:hypothetical protein
MLNEKYIFTLLVVAMLSIVFGQAVFAQGTTTLRDPLVPSASSEPIGVTPPPSFPPPIGSGPTPLPISPGQTNGPTFEPWNLNYPSNDIDLSNSGIGVPIAPPVALPPGVVGPLLTPVTPPAPSVPGAAPPYMQAPPGFINPAQQIAVPAGGIYTGTGGYNSTIPNIPRGGQVASQFEEQGLPSTLGGAPVGGQGLPGRTGQDILYQFGPLAGLGIINGVPTGNGYNKGLPGTNNDNQLSTIDFGGGLVSKVGGTKIPLGKTVQDYGLSTFYNPGIGALTAHRSTEFGQGIPREGLPYNRSTDFGFNVQGPNNPANVNPQNPDALLNKTAILTHF